MKDRARCSWEVLAENLHLFALHAALYSRLGGRLVGRNILLLHTIGRRSGRRRRAALYYARDGVDYLIVASNGGDDHYPGWWHNLRSNPRVTIQVGTQLQERLASEVAADQAEALWPRLLAVYGGYGRYRQRTRRPLTIFRLRPGAAAGERRGETPAAGAARTRQGGGRSAWTA